MFIGGKKSAQYEMDAKQQLRATTTGQSRDEVKSISQSVPQNSTVHLSFRVFGSLLGKYTTMEPDAQQDYCT